MGGNLFWGNHLRCLWIKLRSIDAQVLFRLFHPQTTQSTTAITSIVVAFSHESKKNKIKSLLKFLLLLLSQKVESLYSLVIARFGNAESWQSKQHKVAQ